MEGNAGVRRRGWIGSLQSQLGRNGIYRRKGRGGLGRHSAAGFPSESSARGGCRLGRRGDQLKRGSVNALGLSASWRPRRGPWRAMRRGCSPVQVCRIGTPDLMASQRAGNVARMQDRESRTIFWLILYHEKVRNSN